MHGIGQPPMCGLSVEFMHYVQEAGLPYARLHDVQGAMGGGLFVDIPNLFPNFDADENDPASYEFAFTDRLMTELFNVGCEPLFRLGVTIENYHAVKSFRIFPPKDFAKWARICEHVVRHYREGWADGFRFPVTYWEIWNEPDASIMKGGREISAMWKGTPEQFFELYSVTAKHLKACFGKAIKVGGYGACGFFENATIDPDCNGFAGKAVTEHQAFIKFAHEFLAFIREKKVPLDFFSWHTYGLPKTALDNSRYCRRMLEKYGFGHVEDILDEWNVWPETRRRGTDFAAVHDFAMMLVMQKSGTSMLNYYDSRINSCSPYGGMFNAHTHTPYRTYYAFRMFNDAYRLGHEAFTASFDDVGVPVCGAVGSGKAVLLAANMSDVEVAAEFDVRGANVEEADVIMTNDEYWYTDTGKKIHDNRLVIPPYTCLELKMPCAGVGDAQ